MVTRRLGSAGPEITTLGFGTWALAGRDRFGWGPVDDEESVAAIRRAVEAGVSWIDTAPTYADGHSEEVVGRAIEPFRAGEEALVFTKCGRPWRGGEVDFDLRPDSIRQECEASLRRLGVERIDLYQFHWPDDATGTPVEESWGTMVELVDEGKVRWLGVCNFDVPRLRQCEAIRHVDSLQPPLSLLNRHARRELLPWAREKAQGLIAYSPMASGLLTCSFNREGLDEARRGRLAPPRASLPGAGAGREPSVGGPVGAARGAPRRLGFGPRGCLGARPAGGDRRDRRRAPAFPARRLARGRRPATGRAAAGRGRSAPRGDGRRHRRGAGAAGRLKPGDDLARLTSLVFRALDESEPEERPEVFDRVAV